MAKTEDDGGIGVEVENRLDELFSEDDTLDDNEESPEMAAHDYAETVSSGSDVHGTADYADTEDDDFGEGTWDDVSIDTLKALVSEIEWEINDGTMSAFLSEVDRLKQKYQNDSIMVMFLKLHESIGKYIKSKKARAHPYAIKFVTSVFQSFEKVFNSPDMPDAQKKKIVLAEMKKFKDFKALLSNQGSRTESASPRKEKVAEPVVPSPALKLENQEAINYLAEYLMAELKKVINLEFQKFRQEIGKMT